MKNKIFGADCIFEKKKWISITGLCNNNCMFCLDADRSDKFHKSVDEIKKEIKIAKEEGNTKLVLSGGDPTIHPNLIEFVQHARKMGYGKIQVITNGRMFSSKKFTDEIINAGLDEVTFSIHGCNSEMHDSLTRVPGSFKQVLRGVKNVFSNQKKIIVNTDTCITKSNYRFLLQIIKFIVEKVGITEVNLMGMVPQGNAWQFKNLVLYDFEKVAPHVHKVIDYCVTAGVVLWLSRFPAEHLEGYEEFIEDPYKMVDEVRGRLEMLKDTVRPPCKGEMCVYCSLKKICPDLLKLNCVDYIDDKSGETIYDEEIVITKENYNKLDQLVGRDKKILLRLTLPTKRISEYQIIVPEIKEIVPFLKKVDFQNVSLSGVPFCILQKEGIQNMSLANADIINYPIFVNNGQKDFLGLAEDLSRNLKIKKKACKSCLLFNGCPGIYSNYVRVHGFGELSPITVFNKEIRINLDCNQDCLFCNTDENAENVILEKEGVLKEISNSFSQGMRYLVISGKEPTLNKNIFDYITYSKKKGFFKIELQTNAIKCADENYVHKLKESGLTDAFVSLHADNEELSSKITRAPGTFESTLKGIKNLKREGIGITVNVVVNSINYLRLKSIVGFIHNNVNPKSIVFSVAAPVVNAWKNKEIIPNLTAITPHLNEAFEYCKKNNLAFNIPSRCGIPICLVQEYKERHDEFNEASRFSDNRDKVKNESCRDCVYDGSCTGLWKNYVKLYGSKELKPVKKVTDIDINLGAVCNNDCKFCPTKNPLSNPLFVDYVELRKDVISAAVEGYAKITFLGGEPTIHPKILDIIKLAKKNGFKEIHLVSNGKRYSNAEFLNNVVCAGANKFSVSIHSHIGTAEDFLTGRVGGFDEKIKGLKNLVKLRKCMQIPYDICVNILINNKNYAELDKTVDFFKKMGIKVFRLNSMMTNDGNSKLNRELLLPRFSKIMPTIKKVLEIGSIQVILGDFPLCMSEGIIPLERFVGCVGEATLDKHTSNLFYDINEEGIDKKSFSWKQRKANELKTKPKKCEGCKLYDKCEGVWKEYYDFFGDGELNPIK